MRFGGLKNVSFSQFWVSWRPPPRLNEGTQTGQTSARMIMRVCHGVFDSFWSVAKGHQRDTDHFGGSPKK